MSASVSGTAAPPQVQSGTPAPSAGINFLAPSSGTPAANSTGSQIIPPGAATSPYEYQYVENAPNITLGPELANVLGLANNGSSGAAQTYNGAQIMQAYYDLSPTELQTLQELLYSAGFYSSTAGTALGTRPVFGSFNIDSFNAISQLIISGANNPNTSLTQIINQATSSGAGFYNQQNALQPITMGGNTYQVNLTNPDDIYAVTYQVFEQYLGRAPTQQDYQNILQTVQSQETQYQQAQIGQTETMSQAKYQQAITSRTAENTPAYSAGNVPNGPFSSPAQEATAILQYAYPSQVTASNVAFLAAWIQQNGGVSNNPLGVSTVTQNASMAQGIQAAANLLKAPQYQALNAALQGGNASSLANNQAVQAELTQWSGGGIATALNVKAQQAAAQNAINTYNPAQPAQPPLTLGERQAQGKEASMNLGQGGGALGGVTPAQAAGPATPPPSASGSSLPATQLGQQQGMNAPGDNYLQSNTITNVQAPSAQNAAMMAAMGGSNTIPFYANQFLNVANAITQLINQGPPKL